MGVKYPGSNPGVRATVSPELRKKNMQTELWKLKEDAYSDEYHATFVEPVFDLEARVRWDGCLELLRFFNGNKEDFDQIHICDLDAFIARLQYLKFMAAEKFGWE
jgi:hypothetical protein